MLQVLFASRTLRALLAVPLFMVATVASSAAQNTTTTINSITYAPNGIDESLSYINYSSIVTFSASVIPQSASDTQPINGAMAFYVNGFPLSGGGSVPVQNGVASFVTTNLPVGNDNFTATYTPSSGSIYTGSTTAQPYPKAVEPAVPVISATPLEVVYDGQPHSVAVSFGRTGLHPTIVYYGNPSPDYYSTTPPTNAGTYELVITFTDPGYSGDSPVVPNALIIDHARASLTLSSLNVVYDGNPHPVTFTVDPASEASNVVVEYNLASTVPSAAGAYQVFAHLNPAVSNYTATANGTLIIARNSTSAWLVNNDSTVTQLSPAGALLATAGTASGTSTLGAVAIDSLGNAWSVVNGVNAITEVSSTGTLIGTSSGGGLSAPVSVAVDGIGQIWIANTNNTVSAFANGSPVSPDPGFQPGNLDAPTAIAVDQTGSVWITNAGNSTVTRLLGAAAPVVTPAVAATITSSGGTRP